MNQVPQTTIDHCNKYKGCVDCRFVANRYVAPVSDRDFPTWVENMNKLISEVAG